MDKKTSIQKVHPLNTSWIIWYHNSNDKNWGNDSYKSILEVNTIEDFLVLVNSWDKCLPKVTQGMYFFMRKFKENDIIYPTWEDKYNKDGGYWSFKVSDKHSEQTWVNLCKILIGEVICVSDPMNINGISISPKKNFCIIKIWNNNSEQCDTALLGSDLRSFLNIEEVKYSSHNKNIKRDKDKIEKYKKRTRRGHLTKF
tara:strand:+ start:1311 stop:1907 length:597 start_codon:yes stop_codon:yes gene_type:complete